VMSRRRRRWRVLTASCVGDFTIWREFANLRFTWRILPIARGTSAEVRLPGFVFVFQQFRSNYSTSLPEYTWLRADINGLPWPRAKRIELHLLLADQSFTKDDRFS
jgi:hypothetical protein